MSTREETRVTPASGAARTDQFKWKRKTQQSASSTYPCNPSIQEAEGRAWKVQIQPGPRSKTPTQSKQNKENQENHSSNKMGL